MSRIRALIHSKLDRDTKYFLQEAEKHKDTETHNLRVEGGLPEHHLMYCLWGNIIKNPRLAIETYLPLASYAELVCTTADRCIYMYT